MISIVIFSRNDESRIGRTLAGLFAQKIRDFEVLSCDGGSTDRTGQILDGYPEVRRFELPSGLAMPGAWLNWIVSECRGDIVVFNQAAACPLDADYLVELLKGLSDPAVAACFARREPRGDALFPVWRDMEHILHNADLEQEFSFVAAAVRKDVLRRFPIDETLPMEFGGKWAANLRAAGEKIVYARGARTEFSRQVSWRNLYWLRNREAACRGRRISRRENWKRFCRDLSLDFKAIRRTRYLKFPGILPWRLIEAAARRGTGAIWMAWLLFLLLLLLSGVYCVFR